MGINLAVLLGSVRRQVTVAYLYDTDILTHDLNAIPVTNLTYFCRRCVISTIHNTRLKRGVNMKVFIPITDEMLEQGLIPDELVAYQTGHPVLSQFQSHRDTAHSRSRMSESPGPTPSSDAIPALSSSTYMAGLLLG
mgnify:FL=1